MDVDTAKVAGGFLAAVGVLAALVLAVGVDDVAAALAVLDARTVAGVLALGVLWLVAWGSCLHTVLAAVGVPASRMTAVLLYASAAFANNVTPFGQAGGEPFSGYLISRATGAEYEHGLAGIASVDAINFVPSLALAALGVAYFVVRYAVFDGLRYLAGVVVALAVGVPAAGYLASRYSDRLRAGVVGALASVAAAVDRVVPRFSPPSREQLRERVAGFFASIGRVADDRRRLAAAGAFSTAGWLCLCSALWLTLRGLGHAVPVATAFVVVPVATLASITPLPGGTGGVEFVIVAMLVPTTAVSPATAGAAALVFRVATYWVPTALGGLAVLALEHRTTA